ncbi:hypothetical protein DY000_02014060 [Brassica cretica]|uniref:Uncharacterized protein n=1 Tax=Brassica cretica TaxID=69181 RepID=A0ABQ7D7I7_BRACR|nr:hypothetical protein DY000_02014060 [Brassica cretica]
MGGAVKDIASKSELDNFRHSGAPIALHFWACGVMLRSSWIKSSLTSLPIYLRHDTLLLYTTLCLYEHDDLINVSIAAPDFRETDRTKASSLLLRQK